MKNTIELERLIQSSGADGALIINEKGEVLDALDVSYEGNIAAMTTALLEMANDLVYDLGQSGITQFTCKSQNGIYVVQKYNSETIICAHAKDVSKVGYIMMALKVIKI